MKIRLLVLLGMTGVTLLSMGQTSPVFYNKGKMSIVGTSADKTILYVGGTFIADREEMTDVASKQKISDIYVESSNTVITGHFLQNADVDDYGYSQAHAFADHPSEASKIGKITFRGTTAQKIATIFNSGTETDTDIGNTGTYKGVWKTLNYINFPKIAIENENHVTVSPEISARTEGVILTKGKLILDSRKMVTKDVASGSGSNSGTKTPSIHSPNHSSLLAHLWFPENGVVYPTLTSANEPGTQSALESIGKVQVRLAIDNTVTGNQAVKRRLFGMGSPFQQIRADYFNWNFLMFPEGTRIFGSTNGTITDPETEMKAGKGFIVGIDLKGTEESNYIPDDKWVAQDFKTRVGAAGKDKYIFDRLAYNNKNNIYPLNVHTNKAFTAQNIVSAYYQEEKLNQTNIEYDLVDGYNYLSNPFSSPLYMARLINNNTTSSEWGNIKPSLTSGDIAPVVWVLNPSAYAYGSYEGGKWYLYAKATYHVMSTVGGTWATDYDNGDEGTYVIPPYQMFVIWAYGSPDRTVSKIKMPLSERRYDSGALFLRSGAAVADTKNDDFLLEVQDKTTGGYDRTAVVIRTPEEIENNNYSNIGKVVTSVTGGQTRAVPYIAETRSGAAALADNSTSPASILYTMDSDNSTLESNFVPVSPGTLTKLVPLYLAPSQTAQDISLTAMRVNTMSRVEKILLIDNKINKEFDMSDGEAYAASTSPSDSHDRFTLKFVFAASGIPVNPPSDVDKSLNAYYNTGTLTVSGFDEEDMGSVISVYDIQGRMIKQARVDNLTMKIYEVFSPGAYVVKVVGNNSHVSKFLAR